MSWSGQFYYSVDPVNPVMYRTIPISESAITVSRYYEYYSSCAYDLGKLWPGASGRAFGYTSHYSDEVYVKWVFRGVLVPSLELTNYIKLAFDILEPDGTVVTEEFDPSAGGTVVYANDTTIVSNAFSIPNIYTYHPGSYVYIYTFMRYGLGTRTKLVLDQPVLAYEIYVL